jgi:hypothetical protein
LEAEHKLSEARYFLDKMKTLKSEPEEFMHNLSAFLSAWRSLPDILLYDYAEKYFAWGREDRFSMRDLEVATRASRRKEAQHFAQWYKEQIQSLSRNPLWKKRVVTVHRGRPKVRQTYRLYLLEVKSWDQERSITEIVKRDFSEVTPPAKASSVPKYETPDVVVGSVEFFFEDYPDTEIWEICEEAYENMRNIVKEAQKTFK